jgi:hypothetical protein
MSDPKHYGAPADEKRLLSHAPPQPLGWDEWRIEDRLEHRTGGQRDSDDGCDPDDRKKLFVPPGASRTRHFSHPHDLFF